MAGAWRATRNSAHGCDSLSDALLLCEIHHRLVTNCCENSHALGGGGQSRRRPPRWILRESQADRRRGELRCSPQTRLNCTASSSVWSSWATLARRAQPQQQRLVVHFPQLPSFVADGALACTSQFYLPNYRMGKTLGIGSFGKARVGAWGKACC